MKNRMALVLLAVAFHEPSFAECRMYSLPSRTSISVFGQDASYADRVDIIAAVDPSGRTRSPFSITRYDKNGKQLDFTRVYGKAYAATNDYENVVLGNFSERIVVCDELMVEDGHFKISISKTNDEFFVSVDDLDDRRFVAEVKMRMERIHAEHLAEVKKGPQWPPTDDDRCYYSSAEDALDDVTSPDNSCCWTIKCALYQKDNAFSIRFNLCRGKDKLVEGRIIGEVSDDKIKHSVVTYDAGEGIADVRVSIPQCELGKPEHMKAIRAGIRERLLRVDITCGETKMHLDMAMRMVAPM